MPAATHAAPRPVPLDWGMLTALGMIWGGSFVASEFALRGFTPLSLVTFRVMIGAALLIPLAYALRAPLPGLRSALDRRIWLHIVGLGVLSNVLPFNLLTWAQTHVTAGFAGVSMASMPLFVILLAHFFVAGERLTRRRMVGFLIGFVGVAILFGPAAFASSEDPQESTARLACLAAAFCYACGSIVTRRCPPTPMAAFSAGSLLVAAVVLMPMAVIFDDPFALTPTSPDWIAALFLGAVPTAGAALLLVTLIRRAGPPFLSMVNYMVPVWAAVFGALLLGEEISWSFGVALGLILLGVAYAQGMILRGAAD
ncbi:MAG: drug/metabolite transporter (DMT)-like permease [Paracoccaceae bacterium]|jgi:drug/metabolite transporter (DMT)-like permease